MKLSKKTSYEIRSFITTFGAILATDAFVQINTIYNGDWSKSALLALSAAALRALVKAILQKLFPQLNKAV